MTTQSKQYDWWNAHVTSEIYLNTHRADWWKACMAVARELAGAKSILDVGTGDGHTLWQVLSLSTAESTDSVSVDLIEPDSVGLMRALKRLRGIERVRVKGRADCTARQRLQIPRARERYDVLFAGHVNYYLGGVCRPEARQTYFRQLDILAESARKLVFMSVPSSSDYYKVVENPFGTHVFAEEMVRHFCSSGRHVRVVDIPIRFYVAHAQLSPHEAVLVWKFFSNTEREPDSSEMQQFISRLEAVTDTEGYMNFRDQLVIVDTR